jgi:hypothetical protein
MAHLKQLKMKNVKLKMKNIQFSIFNFQFLILERGFSSVGRAPALQAGCQRFESANLHLEKERSD